MDCPLNLAIHGKNMEIITYLLENGADPNQTLTIHHLLLEFNISLQNSSFFISVHFLFLVFIIIFMVAFIFNFIKFIIY